MKIIDNDKRLVVGLALIPDKTIMRRRGEYEYNIVFSKDTVRKAEQIGEGDEVTVCLEVG